MYFRLCIDLMHILPPVTAEGCRLSLGIDHPITEGATNDILVFHSEHLGQSLDQASDVCRRSNMLRKLTCIAGSSYSSGALYEIIP